jgi:hypothetical protein
MTSEEIEQIHPGDIVRHKSGEAWIVIRGYGRGALAIRNITISNEIEWDKIVYKSERVEE